MDFVVGKWYENRRFRYRVLDARGDSLRVQTDKGETKDISASGQSRIIENMERDALAVKPVGRYRNYCWKCQTFLSDAANPHCPKCGWLICSCEACGCGFPKRWTSARG